MPCARSLRMRVAQLADLLAVHAGCGLVEQQQLRLRRQRARELQPALLAEGQVRRELVLLVGEPAELERARRSRRARPTGRRASARGSRGAHGPRERSAPPTGSATPRAGRRAGCSGRCARCRAAAVCGWAGLRKLSPLKANFTRGDGNRPGDHIHGGALARAVGADQADDLALAHGEVEAVDGPDAAEVAREAFQLKHAGPPRKPCGRRFIAATISAPNSRLRQSPRKRSPSMRNACTKITAASVPKTFFSPPTIG